MTEGDLTGPHVPLPFDEAIRAALETAPEPAERKPFGKRKSGPADEPPVESEEEKE